MQKFKVMYQSYNKPETCTNDIDFDTINVDKIITKAIKEKNAQDRFTLLVEKLINKYTKQACILKTIHNHFNSLLNGAVKKNTQKFNE